MTNKMNFTVFCLESYKTAHKLTGKQVIDYLKSFYDVLHPTEQEYIVADIDKYISSRQQ
ncbi:MAG: DUF3791 domain-containing protein [Spirochaetia bacterium]|jgi:hypothetical protein|nr:DUF3791 domain-containing protein [Spirochaetia bacterium]